ncbi:MAG: T9SS type A sorting domain-containing protein, partial [Bacteroidota bacterium]
TISVQDTIKPKFTSAPQSSTISCTDPLVIAPTLKATDNCTPADSIKITFKEVKTDSVGECGKYQYTVTRTWTATDKCGNSTALTQVLKIEDKIDPVFLGMPDTLVVSSGNFPPNSNCVVPVSLNVNQYLSDCQADSSILVTNDAPHGNHGYDIGGNYDVGNYVIHFSAIDACGNVGLDSIYLEVVDNSAPTIVCNNNVVVSLGTGGMGSIEPSDIAISSSDNCGVDTTWLSVYDFDCSKLGVNQVQLFVRDIHGNVNHCTVEVKVTTGVNIGFTLTATATAESSFGAANGTAKVVATGGSGLFSYKWSNNATTANISNLAAGTYTVTVTDIVNGCISTATVTVDEGAKISLNAGVATGCQNNTVTIPVTIDNLIKSTGFSFTLSLPNLTVGSISGITNINPALTGLIGNPLPGNNFGIFWANAGAPLTLPNGSLLFNVNVQLAAAPLGTNSTVTFSGTPLQLEFSQDSSGTNVIYGINDIDINTGSVTINCAVSNWKISGLVQTWKTPIKPVPGAIVALTGTTTANVTTPANGSYLFSVPDANNTILKPTKVTTGNDGITAADLLFISNHIFNNLLPSPYQWVAADANGDGNITLNDYLRIQKVALGTDQHIQGSPDWKFIPKSYVFPTPNPLSQLPVPQAINFTATHDSVVDWVAVRMGDVNGNITPSLTNDQTDSRTNGTFRFLLDDRSFHSGDVIEVPFRASDFTNRQAYQMTINFDPTVFELTDIKMGALPKLNDDNFGTTYLADGHLTTLWVNRDPITIADGEVLFTLTFRASRNGASLAEVLRAGSEITRAEAYDLDGSVMKVDFDFARSSDHPQELQPFALYQNQPNPFNTGTTIGFRLPESGRASLRVYNMSGRLVKTVVGNFEKGYNEVQMLNNDFGEAGVYWYELETATHSDRKKMILID